MRAMTDLLLRSLSNEAPGRRLSFGDYRGSAYFVKRLSHAEPACAGLAGRVVSACPLIRAGSRVTMRACLAR